MEDRKIQTVQISKAAIRNGEQKKKKRWQFKLIIKKRNTESAKYNKGRGK